MGIYDLKKLSFVIKPMRQLKWTQKDDLCGWSCVCFHVPAGQEVLGVQHLISEDYGRVRIQTHGSQPVLHPQVDEDRRPRLPVTQLSNNTADICTTPEQSHVDP